ncbi:hypothetical protein F4777DRAFT_187452 [Nemania sp. FL0916]|nr:hypothetical protein F4777DRAFT_187452 [Nemania sp. FL0916]
MEQVPPSNNGTHPYSYTYEDERAARTVEQMSSIQEVTEYSNSRSALASRSTKSTLMWPFHNRRASEAPSTTLSSRLGRFRSGTWNSRSILRSFDDTSSIDESLIPDYVINFLRGETPESLARKKEARQWVERNAMITPQRDTLTSSQLIEMSNPFASRTNLTGGESSQQGGLRRHFSGWRGGVVASTLLAFLILIVGIVGIILVAIKTKALPGQLAIYSGDCSAATRISIGIHAVINVFTVALLAGANYVFQVVTSPTRQEISEAHERHRWFNIGVSSLRNFANVSRLRALIGAAVLLVAVGIQVIFNAVIYPNQSGENGCAVNVNGTMLAIAALLNLILVVTMVVVLARTSFDPIATLGDAIRSFLIEPEPTTANASLMTKQDLQRGRWGADATKSIAARSHYWLEAPSLTRWILTILSWLAIAGPTAAAIALLAPSSSAGIRTPFGTATADTTFSFPAPANATQLALVAALPQLLLAILYLVMNTLLTTYFLSHELSLFATGDARPLRVSSRRVGVQTSSLHLSLPQPASLLLLATFAALGLVLSQAAFLKVISASLEQPRVAFNPLALLVLLALLVGVLFCVLALGIRRTPVAGRGSNALALAGGASSSALISARCHAAYSEGELWLGPVAWGVVREASGRGPGQCAFTGRDAGAPDPEGEYA